MAASQQRRCPRDHVINRGDPPAPPPAPLLLVPGVLGTMLAVRPAGQEGADGERCWVNLRSADASYKQLWGKYSRQSSRVELLLEGLEACVPRGPDDSGLYPISVLDPEAGGLVPPLHYFQPFVSHLQDRGYTPGLNLFGCGYDFRQGCRLSAQTLLGALRSASRRCGGARVDIVSHSMGGLVVRSLLADHPEAFEKLVGRWVAIGCPFAGAPGYTVDALLTGVQFGGSLGEQLFVKRETFRQAALQSPSVFELLPPLDFPWAIPKPRLDLWLWQPIPDYSPAAMLNSAAQQANDPTARPAMAAAALMPDASSACVQCPHCGGHVQLPAAGPWPGGAADASVKHSPLPCASHVWHAVPAPPAGIACDDGRSRGSSAGQYTACTAWASQYVFQLDHLPGLLNRLLEDNAVTVGSKVVPLPFEPELWEQAQATRTAWAAAELPPSCAFYNLYGNGVSTPWDCTYGAWWHPLQSLASLPAATAAFSYVVGDGTVPAESARAHGLRAVATAEVQKVAHRDLVSSQTVWDQVLVWLATTRAAPATAGAPDAVAAQDGSSCRRAGSQRSGGPAAAHPSKSQRGEQGQGEEESTFWNPLAWQSVLG
ncbi:hypothetical protein ABPG77_007199 [Micractinium sp. CCAP 211/92]